MLNVEHVEKLGTTKLRMMSGQGGCDGTSILKFIMVGRIVMTPKQPSNCYPFSVCLIMGEFHDQGDAKWIVIRRSLWVIMIHPVGGQPPAGLSAAWALATRRAYLVV
jgi:hypothetical protein